MWAGDRGRIWGAGVVSWNARIEVDDAGLAKLRIGIEPRQGSRHLGFRRPMAARPIRMLGLVGCSAAALPCCPGRKHVSRAAAGPTSLAHFFYWHLSTKIWVFLFFLFSSSDSSWASSHGVAASIGDAYVAFGTLVSMDAQRRKRSVVNHCCQFLQSGGCFILRDLHSCLGSIGAADGVRGQVGEHVLTHRRAHVVFECA